MYVVVKIASIILRKSSNANFNCQLLSGLTADTQLVNYCMHVYTYVYIIEVLIKITHMA